MANTTSIMKNAENEARRDATEMQAQIDKLSSELASLTRTVSDYGNGKFEGIAREARRMSHDVADRSVAVATAAGDGLATAESDLEVRIREHPLTAIGVAAGVGFLAALLTKR